MHCMKHVLRVTEMICILVLKLIKTRCASTEPKMHAMHVSYTNLLLLPFQDLMNYFQNLIIDSFPLLFLKTFLVVLPSKLFAASFFRFRVAKEFCLFLIERGFSFITLATLAKELEMDAKVVHCLGFSSLPECSLCM